MSSTNKVVANAISARQSVACNAEDPVFSQFRAAEKTRGRMLAAKRGVVSAILAFSSEVNGVRQDYEYALEDMRRASDGTPRIDFFRKMARDLEEKLYYDGKRIDEIIKQFQAIG